MEEWKTIIEAPNYEVSNLGRIRNKKLNRYVRTFINNSGYIQVVLRKDNRNLYRLVHRLVAIHFIDNPDNYCEVNHKDFDKTNNTVENLEWTSHKLNMKHNRLKSTCVESLTNRIIKECSKVIRENINKYVDSYAID